MTASFPKMAAIIALGLSAWPVAAAAQDIGPVMDDLAASFPDGEAAAFSGMLADMPEGVSGDTFGHLLFARRQFDRAAWFFGHDALADPGDPASLNNFAAMATETYLADPGAHPASWLQAAHAAARRAVDLAPDQAAFHNNLGNVARALGLADEAVAAARQATELDPDTALFWTNLARALDAAGDPAAAAAALARAHALGPNAMELLATVTALPDARSAYQSEVARNCNVNFNCQEICPRSIIGGLMSVSCEIENASAQMACAEGKPYPTSYRCEEEIPEYGILIPGLNAGFSIAVPGFSVHVVVQGDGSLDVRVEAGASIGPVGGYVRGDGHYSPTDGASVDNLGGGVRVTLLPPTAAGDLAAGLGHPPVHIEAESLNGEPAQINLETYNAGIISY